MKKMNNKGFMLTETLIVSTLLITVLLIVFVQFKSINKKINNSFNYDKVSSQYNLYNVKLFVEQEDFSVIVGRLDTSNYVDLTTCDSSIFTNTNYCETIINRANIKKVIMTNENLYELAKSKSFNKKLNENIKNIKYETNDGYKLIAEFKDGTFANVKVLNNSKFDSIIANACVTSVKKGFTINYVTTDNQVIQAPYTGKVGCSTQLSVASYDNLTNSCYHATNYSNNTIVIDNDETHNVATITYEKYTSNLIVHHLNKANNTSISTDTTISGTCGNKYQIEQYKKTISGYNYDSASTNEVILSNSNTEVNLFYTEGSGS